MSRRKGANGELEFAKVLPYDAHRGRQYHGRPDAPDVKTDDGIQWECKRVEALRLVAALEQARKDAGISGRRDLASLLPERVPAVAWRKNHRPWVVMVEMPFLEAFCVRFLRACGYDVKSP